MGRSHQLNFVAAAGVALFGLYSSSCIMGANQLDFYAEVMPTCGYRTLEPAEWQGDAIYETTLTDDCREALESILPFDSTWDQAPRGLKDKVMEAYQVIAAFPLKMPDENRVLGVAPYGIPTTQLCILDPQGHADDCIGAPDPSLTSATDLNKNVFNWAVARLDRITYGPVAHDGEHNDSISAQCTPSLHGWLLTVEDSFWNNNPWASYYARPFIRAAILVHEARHADSRPHELCNDKSDLPGKYACDPDLSGPYALESFWEQAFVRGSAGLTNADGSPVLSDQDINIALSDACYELLYRNNGKPPEVRALVESTMCSGIDMDYAIAKMGVVRPGGNGTPLEGSDSLSNVAATLDSSDPATNGSPWPRFGKNW
ncbi:MAG TPA: hypothetical protein VL588_05080 [Bdellovibrionota bacterium]|nr:hypothetical protein [Bdellovibrionota bacterium]